MQSKDRDHSRDFSLLFSLFLPIIFISSVSALFKDWRVPTNRNFSANTLYVYIR